MGQCCSSMAGPDIEPIDRALTNSSARHATEVDVGVLSVPAAVHAASTQHSTQQHHLQHPYSAQDRRSGVIDVEGRAQQRLLLPAPSLQLQPHSNLSLSSLHQLQQLLPAAPLQQLTTLHAYSTPSTCSGSTRSKDKCAHDHSSVHSRLQAASTQNSGVLHSTAQLQPHIVNKTGGGQDGSKASAGVMMPVQILSVCAAVMHNVTDFQEAGVTPMLLASLCLIESAGYPRPKQHREHLGATSHGICQVVLSTAQWLATSQGFCRHGTCLRARDLEHPAVCIYFAAAHLSVLSRHDGILRSEAFVVKAYHAGPKNVATAAATTYLRKYLKAKHHLTQVAYAMAVTVAAAALKMDLQLPCALQLLPRADDSAQQLPCAPSGTKKPMAPVSSTRSSPCTGDGKERDSIGARDVNSAATHAAPAGGVCVSKLHQVSEAVSQGSSRLAIVPGATAALVDTLCTSWFDSTGTAVSAAQHTAAACGVALKGLPGKEDCARTQQQQQQQHDQKQGCTATRHTSWAGATSTIRLVSTDALHTAWLMLLCISPAVAEAALEQASAFEARGADLNDAQGSALSDAGLAPAAALTTTMHHSHILASNSNSHAGDEFSSPGASRGQHHQDVPGNAAAVADCVAQLPCMLHIVGHGETAEGIAQTCDLNLTDLLAANPDIREAAAICHNDCIAIPVPAVIPRLHVARQGDSLTSIARTYGLPLGRILAKNPELAELSSMQPGWVVALPGLKGDSQVSLPEDWLARTALTADLQELRADASGTGRRLGYQQELSGANKQQQLCHMFETRHRLQAAHGHIPHKHSLLQPGAINCALQADTTRTLHCGQQRRSPALPVGSGAFLFSVGGHSDSRSSRSTEHSPSDHHHRQQQQLQISGAPAGVSKRVCKDSNRSAAAAAGVGFGWTVGTHPGA